MFFWNGEFKMCYLTLTGSFADMILLPSAGAKGTYKAGIFVLSSLDNCIFMMMLACLLRLPFYCAVEYSELIPIADSIMTVAKFSVLPAEFIAGQLKNRVSFRKAMKRAIELTELANTKGIQVQIAGRIDGKEIARVEWIRVVKKS
ncbi:hypothetical protein LWI28_024684 [Acer negundo]|uniref:Small ribosomal subunit protein uS3 C-terminal domain-containing protein n=1 Tax=Acer negundo TaxID=4023 RepID=A0AAD5IAG1_ACENE|nr:hypothetical protein LWI28_024684 [Acer negundo]